MHLNKTYEAEINLKDLLFHVLYRWRSILLFALIGAAVFCGRQYLTLKNIHDAGKQTKEERQYQLDLQSYQEDLVSTRNAINSNSKLLQSLNTYLSESVYIQLDPNAVWMATCNYVVKVDVSELEKLPQGFSLDPADSVLPAYVSPLSLASDEELVEAFGIEKPEYVNELIEVKTNPEDNSVIVSLKGESKEAVQREMILVQEKMKELTGKAQEIEKHTLVNSGESIFRGTDEKLSSKQSEMVRMNEQYRKDLQTSRQTLDGLEARGVPAAPGKHLLKNAVMGALLGGFLTAFLYVILFAVHGRLKDSRAITEKYDLPLLGEIQKSGSRHHERGLDKVLARWELGKEKGNEELVYKNICALIEKTIEGKKILLISTLPETFLKTVKESISVHMGSSMELKTKGQFLRNEEAIPEATEADAVIIVEEKGVSHTREIERMADSLIISRAKVRGTIIL